MKLLNKKTGEIATLTLSSNGEELLLMKNNEMVTRNVKLSDLDVWEDYEEPKKYYVINPVDWAEVIGEIEYRNDSTDKINKEIGNYFETKEEAEKAVEKLKAWKRLKDKGFRFDGVNGCWVEFTLKSANSYEEYEQGQKDLLLLFGGEE